MDHGLHAALILLSAAVVVVSAARLLRLPSVPAYLIVGIAIGPSGLGLLARDEATSRLAEFGVVFLMFSIGLEFSLTRLVAMRRLVFGLGGAQVLLTIAATTAVATGFGLSWEAGVALGGALAMSSTAIVGKLLSEKFELHSLSGRQTMGVLLFQDLAVVPLLILYPALTAEGAGFVETLGFALLKAAAALALVVVVGQRLVRRWMDAVVRRKSSELFVLNVLWLTVGLAYLTELAGLSLSLGAFLAGMLISETVYRHQVEADIRPFRDVLLGLFFVTIGMLLDLAAVWQNLTWVLVILLGLVTVKGLLVMALSVFLRNNLPTALRTAAQLAQAGEFGFVLLTVAGGLGLLAAEVVQAALAPMLLSMLIAPVVIERAARLGERISRSAWLQRSAALQDIAVHAFNISEHVIICGFGRTGQSLARFFRQEGIPLIALDIDAHRVRQAEEGGENVVYGDADRREVLIAAGLQRARAVIITYADVASALKALGVIRHLAPALPVLVRAPDDSTLEQLKMAGATEVVPEVLEGSLMLATQAMTLLGVPAARAMERVQAVRERRYALLREYYRGETDAQTIAGHPAREIRSVHVEPGAAVCGIALGRLGLARHDVRIDALVRAHIRIDEPDEDLLVEGGDVLVLSGAPAGLHAAERDLLGVRGGRARAAAGD